MFRSAPILFSLLSAAMPAAADTLSWGYNTHGMPGLIDMPGAHAALDGELALTSSHFVDQTRHSLTFQIAPRLTGAFRYSLLYGVSPNEDGETVDFRFDRSFALQFLVVPETDRFPAISVGLNDFLGTGFYSSEYVVATRTLGENVRLTAGLGWGRLAGVGSFDNPLSVFGESWNDRARTINADGLGGRPETGEWFRGPAAFFGGIAWQPDPDWTLIAEYSSDAYPAEAPYVFDRRSPVNLGLRYQVSDRWQVGAQYLYGSELGVQVTYAIDPATPRFPSGLEAGPPLVRAASAATGWGDAVDQTGQARARSRAALAAQGITLHGLALSANHARVEIVNDQWRHAAQAVGRTARVLTATLPPQVTTFEIVVIERGLPVTVTTIRRADLEELEFALDGAWGMQARADIADAGPGTDPVPGLYPRFTWDAAPYINPVLFDPDAPLRADFGLDLSAAWEPAPGLILSGLVRQTAFGNLDESTRASTSVLPHVRSDAWLYDKADTAISRLTAGWYFRPGDSLYGRVTAGLLEPMFGGVSAELLWYPADSPLAFGAEIAHVVQRDYDQDFDFRDYEITSGHLSAYWDMGGGYEAQLDLGRYLAGDWGATLALDRRFENGWAIGAFATLTDVSTEDFGEGAFDKGIRLTIPIDWVSGQPTRDTSALTIRPVLRDGGARLDVDGRLFETLRGTQGLDMAEGWGRFWR